MTGRRRTPSFMPHPPTAHPPTAHTPAARPAGSKTRLSTSPPDPLWARAVTGRGTALLVNVKQTWPLVLGRRRDAPGHRCNRSSATHHAVHCAGRPSPASAVSRLGVDCRPGIRRRTRRQPSPPARAVGTTSPAPGTSTRCGSRQRSPVSDQPQRLLLAQHGRILFLLIERPANIGQQRLAAQDAQGLFQ